MNERHPYSLVGIDGNAFSVMGYTINAMKQCGYSRDAIQCYKDEAMSGDYDHLLSTSCMMVDNCNKLSGYDNEFQQLMKGYDDLEYVDHPHSGTQNRTEKLIDEAFDPFDPFGLTYDDDETDLDFESDSDEEYYNGDDYCQLYHAISSTVKIVLNNYISYKSDFTKADVKRALLNIMENENFWYYLDQEVPENRLNESSIIPFLQDSIEQKLIHKFDELLRDNVKFSKYDVKHAFLQLMNSSKFWGSFPKYIKEG